MKVIQIGNISSDDTSQWDNPSTNRVYSVHGISPCLNSMSGGGRTPLILVRKNNGQNQSEKRNKTRICNDPQGGVMNIAFPESDTRRGRVIDDGMTSPTLDTGCEVGQVVDELRIRKLTPKECFRLQGVSDEMFERAESVNSDSQLYKQAGNACSVPVIYEIAKKMEGGDDNKV